MAVLICHPGTGTIIDAAECYVLVLDDEDETPTEEIEASMDKFHQMVAPEGMSIHTTQGAMDFYFVKRM
jgi:hypothetical protein